MLQYARNYGEMNLKHCVSKLKEIKRRVSHQAAITKIIVFKTEPRQLTMEIQPSDVSLLYCFWFS